MRILITSDIFPPDVGGPATYVPAVADELEQRGHEVTVATYSLVASHPADAHHHFQIVRLSAAPPRWRRIPRTVRTIVACGGQADVIYANGLATETVLANSVLHKPILAKVVGDLAWERSRDKGWIADDFETFQKKRYSPKVEWMRWRRNFTYRRMHQIIVPSRYLSNVLIGSWRLPAERIQVVYNSFEVSNSEAPPIQLDLPVKHTIITVCRLTGWKGVDGLIQVLADLTDTGLVVVGDGPLRDDLLAQARELKVDGRVRFIGTIPKQQVPTYLRACDVFVLNSSYEGLPHVLLEAMIAGLPVIATNVGGIPEVIDDQVNGLLIPPQDPKALKEALLRLRSDPFKTRSMVDRSRETLARFSLQTMVRQTEAIISEVAQAEPR
jgi:glycosyltransferase involved in cell wall biosynthesis